VTPPLQGRRDVATLGLGYSYETGRRVAVSLPKAVELYEAAARAGTGGLDSPGGGDVSIEATDSPHCDCQHDTFQNAERHCFDPFHSTIETSCPPPYLQSLKSPSRNCGCRSHCL
jgi:hypothetical protein